MMTTEDSMQYDESYGAYEEGYDEGAYYQEGGQEAAGGAGKQACPHCRKLITRINLPRHIRVQHMDAEPAECPQCFKVFKSSYNMKEHQRTAHGILQKCLL